MGLNRTQVNFRNYFKILPVRPSKIRVWYPSLWHVLSAVPLNSWNRSVTTQCELVLEPKDTGRQCTRLQGDVSRWRCFLGSDVLELLCSERTRNCGGS